jgi:hypothetical protein
MKICHGRLGMVAAAALSLVSNFLHAQVNVTTYHYDVSRTGQNTEETILTPSNVNASTFGKLFSVALDGWVYAQPLYLSNVTISGGTHNVVYVVTEHDSLYAIDANNGTVYWKLSLIPAGGSTLSSVNDLYDCGDLVPEVGITGTPVIDPSSGTIYLVASSKVGGNIVQYLHAIDVVTHTEKFGGPVKIQASLTNATGVTVSFSPQFENQRESLLLDKDSEGNSHVIIGWGSHCDFAPWHGWLMSYNAATLAQEAVFNSSPNGNGNGIWQSGAGPAADSSGNIYFATGNGNWNGTTDFGDSIVKVGPPSGGAFPVLDYFTPWDQSALESGDLDVSSGGLILLPTATNGKQQLVLQAKTGTIFNLNSSNLGKYCPNQTPACTNSDTQISQEIVNATAGIWGAPAYWNNYVYWAAGNDDTGGSDHIKAFAVNPATGLLTTPPTSQSAQTFGFSAPVPTVSSNGTANGILWGLDDSSFYAVNPCTPTTNCQVLYAYQATNLANLLYTSNQAANLRDVPGGAVKFATPIVANGKVYVGSQYKLTVYGLLTGTPAATPVFNPAAGSYTSVQSVTITDATPGSTIYYTTNGTTPTTASTLYTGAIAVSATTTINAVAVASGYTNSAVATATYTIGVAPPTLPTPTFSPAAGSYTSVQSVTITDATAGSTIYYTTNGTTPTTASTLYTGAITVGATTTINAIAVATGYTNSAVATANYTIAATTVSTPTFSPTAGSYSGTQSVTITDATPGSTIYYTTNGTMPTTASTLYTGAITVSATTTIEAIAVATGYTNSAVATATYTVNTVTTPPVDITLPSPTIDAIAKPGTAVPGGGLDGAGDAYDSSLLGSTVTWSGVTFNLGAPEVADAITSSTIQIAANTYSTLYLLGTAVAGNQPAQAFVVTYTDGSTTTFTQGVSDWGSPQTYPGESIALTMADRVTANGTLNTQNFYLYGYSFALNPAKTVQSFTLPANNNVKVLGIALQPTSAAATATPVLSPAGGSYTGTQSVTITDATPGSKIYYTTNGTIPTTTSPVYSGAIPVSATTTINAIAVAAGYTNSAVATATYTISTSLPVTATPVLSPAGGSYTSPQSVTITDATAGSTIYYTTNGTTPTTGSTLYTGAIPVSATTTIEAIAVATGYTNSAVAAATYTISTVATTPIDIPLPSPTVYAIANPGTAVPGGGFDGVGDAYDSSLLGSTLTWSGVTFDLGAPEVADAITSSTIQIAANTYSTLYLLGAAIGGSQPAQSFVVTYTDGTTTTFTQGVSDWFSPQSYPGESIALAMADRVTSNGAIDARTFNLYGYSFALNPAKTVQSFTLPANNFVKVLGIALQPTSAATATPVLSPAGGSYTSAQSVTITDATAGSKIYYTINGTTPTTASTLYTGAIPVSATTTINAIATSAGATTSAVATATYTISTSLPVTATPVLSPAGGSYTSAQSVTITDATAGSTIYYTINGTTPTTASTLYTGAIPVSATTTIEAIAVATGYTNSAVATATYTIGTTTTTPVDITLTSPTIYGIANRGTAVPGGGLDGAGDAYDSSLLGSTVTWSGVTFELGGPEVADAITSTTISITANTYSTLYLLGTAVDGNQPAQSFVVTYTDGTTTTFTQGVSNWNTPQSYAGESIALAMADRLTSSGSLDKRTFDLYGYSFALNPAKTVQSLKLPANKNVKVLAIALQPTSAATATPVLSPAGGSYTSAQSVTITDATAGSKIYYTTNGTTPTTGSTLYSGAIPVSATTTIEAIAVAAGYANSAIATATYTISTSLPVTATPVPSPAGGSYTSAQSVTITDATGGSTIYYTTNGTTPTTASTLYTGAIPVSATTTIEAIAVATGYSNSAVATATYTIGTTTTTPVDIALTSPTIYGIANSGTPVPNGGLDGSGYAYDASLLGSTLTWSGVTFDLGAPEVADAITSTTIPIAANTYSTLYLLGTAVKGSQAAQAFVVTYTDGTTTTFTQSLSDWGSSQSYPGESVALKMADRVAANGTLNTQTFNLYGYSFALNPAKTVQTLKLPANNNVRVLGIALQPTSAATATPVLSPAGGTYTSAQSVTITDATAGSKIYYTTNGTTPTTASTLYSAAIPVSATTTINAIATSAGATTSPVATATYTISISLPVTATPVLSPAAGSFTSAQSVSITDATAGSTIYYTINGTTPTTASTLYSGAIPVSATTTIEAIAVATGYSNSAVATGTYTIGAAPPVDITLPSPTIYGIATRGTAVPSGGLDGSGYAYDSSLLGSTLTWSGVTFDLGAPEVADAITSATIPIAANTYSTLYLLGTAVKGSQAAQAFVVTYTDGTTATFTQSLSDWGSPQSYPGESVALKMADRVTANGTLNTQTFNLYGYSFALNPAKTVQNLKLPANNNVKILAIALQPSA